MTSFAEMISLAIPVSPAAPAGARSALANVVNAEAAGRAMNGTGCTDEQWDAWSAQVDAAYAKIEALPIDPRFAAVRARAVMEIVDRDMAACLEHPEALLTRLVRQTIQSLAGATNQ